MCNVTPPTHTHPHTHILCDVYSWEWEARERGGSLFRSTNTCGGAGALNLLKTDTMASSALIPRSKCGSCEGPGCSHLQTRPEAAWGVIQLAPCGITFNTELKKKSSPVPYLNECGRWMSIEAAVRIQVYKKGGELKSLTMSNVLFSPMILELRGLSQADLILLTLFFFYEWSTINIVNEWDCWRNPASFQARTQS